MSIHEFTVKSIDGNEIPLSDYAGKLVLITIPPANVDLPHNMKNWNRFTAVLKIRVLSFWDSPATSF